MKTILTTCCNEGCTNQFRVPEFSRPNSTIKTKLDNIECRNCKNKKLLERANFNTKGYAKKNRKNYANKLPVDERVANAKNGREKKRTKKRRTSWRNKDTSKLIQHVQYKITNPYIRARDIACFGKCISCRAKITQAGHRYSVGDFPGMRFLINNIHGQEVSCNHHKSGNIDAYERGLILRHGQKYVDDLKETSYRYLRGDHHWYRCDIIEIGDTYQHLMDNRIWIFHQSEFDKHRDILFGR